MWTNTKRIWRSGFINFWRNAVVSIASILVLTVSLLVIGGLLLGSAFLHSTLESIQSKVDISVSFTLDAAEADISALQTALKKMPEVKDVVYHSRDEELADFKARHADNALLIQSLDEVGNPFGARIDITATDPGQYKAIAQFLDSQNEAAGSNSIIDQVVYKKDLVDKLIQVIDATQRVSVAIALVLILMSILVTFNTVSLTIYIAREEISVMRLVGASSSYVQGPFLVEGIISGVISAIIAAILLYPSALWLRGATSAVYGGVNLASYYLSNFGQIFLILLLSGIALGAVASWLAIRKYLKV